MKKVPIQYIDQLKNIPSLNKEPLKYVMEDILPEQELNDLWLEFGVYTGTSINYISTFTKNIIYGFDSFEGLPEDWRPGFEKGKFSTQKNIPYVNKNVELIQGLFQETLENFLEEHKNKKVSFLHLDADLYSSTKYVLNKLKDKFKKGCIIVFDELLNYPGFDEGTGELLSWYEFTLENNIKYEWIGMYGKLGDSGTIFEKVALRLK